MIDLKQFRSNPQPFIDATRAKGFDINFDEFIQLDKEVLTLKKQLDDCNHERNELSKSIETKMRAGEGAQETINNVKELKYKVEEISKTYHTKQQQFMDVYLRIPNIMSHDVPHGKSDAENVEEEKVGDIKNIDFTPQPHWDILEKRGLLDSERAVKISGSRFVILRDQLVQLEFAMINRVMDKLRGKGFHSTMIPNLVKEDAMYSTGFMPYGEDTIYEVTDTENKTQMYLIGTSEVPLVAQHAEETFDPEQLPLRYMAFSSCYRKEAGTYGKDTKGLIRLHQFEKIEMVSFTTAAQSQQEHDIILAIEEEIFQELQIPYRKLLICSGDLGMQATKKYDLEAWFPGMNTYKEVTSCSNCTDFQSRRAQIKYRKDGRLKEFVHTLNGTALALGRAMAALIENHQTKDGTIIIPAILQPYMGNQTEI